jgi:hypothetical protein
MFYLFAICYHYVIISYIKHKEKKMIGKTFNKLTVISIAEYKKGHGFSPKWNCICSCGNTTIVDAGNLRSGHTKSCGCLYIGTPTHKGSKTPLYRRWANMKSRCYDTNSTYYYNYGGRGITVSEEWHNFESFKKDMIEIPFPKAQIDRIDNTKGYSKENCRWVTPRENSLNRSNNKKVSYDGKNLTCSELSELTGLKTLTIYNRIFKLKYTIEEALSLPTWQRRKTHI